MSEFDKKSVLDYKSDLDKCSSNIAAPENVMNDGYNRELLGRDNNYAFDSTNFLLLAIGFAIVVIGFVLMSGGSSTEHAFNPDVFSVRRIKVAPVICFIGFVSLIYAIIRKPKH